MKQLINQSNTIPDELDGMLVAMVRRPTFLADYPIYSVGYQPSGFDRLPLFWVLEYDPPKWREDN